MPDSAPAEDIWRFEYLVSGRDFASGEILDIYFYASIFERIIEPVSAPHADWDPIVYRQPNPLLLPGPGAGIYDVMAVTNMASLADPFVVDVVIRQGASTNFAPQPVEIYDAQLQLVETTAANPATADAAVPEPATGALITLGALALLFCRRQRVSNQ